MTPVSVAGAVIDAYQIDVKIKTRDNYGPGHPILVVLFNAGPPHPNRSVHEGR